MYSALQDDNATTGSFLKLQETGAPSNINTYHAVDFRSLASLHQLESVYPTNLHSFPLSDVGKKMS